MYIFTTYRAALHQSKETDVTQQYPWINPQKIIYQIPKKSPHTGCRYVPQRRKSHFKNEFHHLSLWYRSCKITKQKRYKLNLSDLEGYQGWWVYDS